MDRTARYLSIKTARVALEVYQTTTYFGPAMSIFAVMVGMTASTETSMNLRFSQGNR
jgi:hypothetical protein